MPILFGASVAGVSQLVTHIVIEADNTAVTTPMVTDWLTGFAAHVGLKLGVLSALSTEHSALVQLAARRIVERYVAGDVLDAAYAIDTGRTETPPGESYRAEALAELAQLVESVLLYVGLDDGGVLGGEVTVAWPPARVTMGMQW